MVTVSPESASSLVLFIRFTINKNIKIRISFTVSAALKLLRNRAKEERKNLGRKKKDAVWEAGTREAIAANPTQEPVGKQTTVYDISPVPKWTLFIGKMTNGNVQYPLFDVERHSLSVFFSQVLYQILQGGQKFIVGTVWKQLCNGWRRDKGFGKYKSWGVTEGSNNRLDALRKAMKVGEMSAEVKVLEKLVENLFDTHKMDREEIFVRVGIIQTCRQTQQVRSIFVELICNKADSHY